MNISVLSLSPIPCDLTTINAIIQDRIIGNLVFKDAVIPLYVYGKLIFVECHFAEKHFLCGLISKSTRISLATTRTSGFDHESRGDLERLVADISQNINLLERLPPNSRFSNIVMATGVRNVDRFSVLQMMEKHFAIRIPPLHLLFSSQELDGFEEELVRRKGLVETWFENQQCDKSSLTTVLVFQQVEFLGPLTLKCIQRLLTDIAQGNLVALFIAPEDPLFEQYMQTLFPGMITIPLSTGDGIEGLRGAKFDHQFNTEGLGMSEEQSVSTIRDALRQSNVASVGKLMRRGLSSWKQVYGYGQVIERLRETIRQTFIYPDQAARLGVNPTKGILLHGPSGCGKTKLVQAVANDGLVPMLAVRPTDILSKYFGESEATLRRVFADARKLSPCILFIDNIEVLGARRKLGGSDSTGVSERLLSTLLNEMDGIEECRGVMVIACTNRLGDLDDALIRPGRLDQHLEVPLPSPADISALSRGVAEKLHLEWDSDRTADSIVELLGGRSIAEILSLYHQFARIKVAEPLPLSARDFLDFTLQSLNREMTN